MNTFGKNPWMTLVFGFVAGAVTVAVWPQQRLTASSANTSDKFSMVTVPVEGIADTEAVFILNHLTGILRGGRLNNQSGRFTHQYVHNVAADFQVRETQRNPEYCIVSGPAQLNAVGNQPSRGAIYIAEKNSGAVIAYGFAMPRGPGVAAPMPLMKIDFFNFREGI